MKTVLLVAVLLAAAAIVAGLAYVRLAQVPPERWHIDPVTAPDPGLRGVRLVPPDAPVFTMTPEALMEALDAVILAGPRTLRIAGSVEDGFATYLKRTKWMAFPDTTTVRVLPEGDGATVAILSRSVYGGYDWGVNAARVDRWLAAARNP